MKKNTIPNLLFLTPDRLALSDIEKRFSLILLESGFSENIDISPPQYLIPESKPKIIDMLRYKDSTSVDEAGDLLYVAGHTTIPEDPATIAIYSTLLDKIISNLDYFKMIVNPDDYLRMDGIWKDYQGMFKEIKEALD